MFSYPTLLAVLFILKVISSTTISHHPGAKHSFNAKSDSEVVKISPTAVHEIFDSMVGNMNPLSIYREGVSEEEEEEEEEDTREIGIENFRSVESLPSKMNCSVHVSDVSSSEDESDALAEEQLYYYENGKYRKIPQKVLSSKQGNTESDTKDSSSDIPSEPIVSTAKPSSAKPSAKPREELPESLHEKMISSIAKSNYENFMTSLEQTRNELELAYKNSLAEYFDSRNSPDKCNCQYKILQQLLSFGVNPNLTNCFGETTLIQAVRNNDLNLYRIIAPHCDLNYSVKGSGPPISALYVAIINDNFEMVKLLLKDGASYILPEKLFTLISGENNVFHLVSKTNSVKMASVLRDSICQIHGYPIFIRLINSSPSNHPRYCPLSMSLWYHNEALRRHPGNDLPFDEASNHPGKDIYDWFKINGATPI